MQLYHNATPRRILLSHLTSGLIASKGVLPAAILTSSLVGASPPFFPYASQTWRRSA